MKMIIDGVNITNEAMFINICERYGYGGRASSQGHGVTDAFVKYFLTGETEKEEYEDAKFVLALIKQGFVIRRLVEDDE